MLDKIVLISLILISTIARSEASVEGSKKQIKTYMAFGLPVDPAHIRTLVDLDISYSLASTLVDWDQTRDVIAGLAKSWNVDSEKVITFHLRDNLVWSDGSPLTAQQVVKSFQRAKSAHGAELKSLFDLIESLKATSEKDVLFNLKVPVATSGILKKITEAMYGVLYIKDDGSVDLTKSSGPFRFVSANNDQIVLEANKRWFEYEHNMADTVIIKRPPSGEELQESFLNDKWANLMSSSSLINEELHSKYKSANYTLWNRNLDKVFFLSPSPKLQDEDGRNLFKFLSAKLDKNRLTNGLKGVSLSDQFSPSGYVLFDIEFKKEIRPVDLPKRFAGRPLKILGADSRLGRKLQENFKTLLKEITGYTPEIKVVPLSEFEATRVKGDFDFVAGALPVNDPNVEGAMSFFFGLNPAIIPNADGERGNFKKRVDSVKTAQEHIRNLEYRKVFSDATNMGCILPLFHYSTMVVAKEGLDISRIPTTDETAAFKKVRFK
jgi:MarR-like DNA-binding transcriptional regulator SgrR of sgrS sRNA